MKPFWLGVTGNIGSGKSTVSRILSELGAGVVDSDVEAHAMANEDAEYRKALTERFGQGLFRSDGTFDRPKFAQLLFGDAVAVSDFNAIISSRLVARTRSKMNAHAAAGKPVVVLDGALIFEYGRHTDFNEVWLVTAEPEIVQERLHARGLSDEQIERRRAAQWDEAVKIPLASRIIKNNGTNEDLKKNVEKYWHSLPI